MPSPGKALPDFDAALYDVDDLIARPDVIDSPLAALLNDYVFASSIFPASVTLDYTWISQPLAWRPVPPSNSLTATRTGGISASVTNAASIAEYGTFDPGGVELDTALDADAAALTTFVTTYENVFLQRPPVLTFDLLPRTPAECWRILSITEGTRVALANTPSTWPAECRSVFVDGIAHSIGIDERIVTFTCSPLVGQAAGQVGPWLKADTSYPAQFLDVVPF
jgi:hypothetical protein